MKWEETTLGEIITANDGFIQTGPFGSQLHVSDYKEIGIPVVMPINIKDGKINLTDIKRISDRKVDELNRHKLQPGEIVYSRRGDLERHALVTNREKGWLCGTGCLKINIGKSKVYPPFLSYYLMQAHIRSWIINNAVGTTMLNLNSTILNNLPLTLPPLPEQKAIAAILGALDDKIDLNRRMNHTLEETARALFKSWFVDFDPVVAKAAGRRPFGMDAETAQLFPDSFEDSKLGMIPKGWRTGSANDLAEYINGKNFTKDSRSKGLIVIRIAELNNGIGSSTKFNDVRAEPENIAFPDDILFAWSGSLGIYRWHWKKALINQHIFKVIPKDYPKWFVYYQLLSILPHFQNIAAGKAVTMGHIKRSHLDEKILILPNEKKIIREADLFMNEIFSMMHRNEMENTTLTQTRDLLLPKLISGEIPVAQAAARVKEAL